MVMVVCASSAIVHLPLAGNEGAEGTVGTGCVR